jgi:hypothetical protein
MGIVRRSRMTRPKNHREPTNVNRKEDEMIDAVDELREFQEFKKEILPVLRAEIKKGTSAEELYKKFESIAAARNVMIAMTDKDSGRALSAIKDILDRTQGRAVERTTTTHKFEKLKDEELDALLKSRLKEVADTDEEETKNH